MNSIIKKMLLAGLMLLPSACAHYHPYYPSNTGYNGGYTIMHGNYYRDRPEYYGYNGAYFPPHRQDRQYEKPRWEHRDSSYPRHDGHHYEDRDNDDHSQYWHRR